MIGVTGRSGKGEESSEANRVLMLRVCKLCKSQISVNLIYPFLSVVLVSKRCIWCCLNTRCTRLSTTEVPALDPDAVLV